MPIKRRDMNISLDQQQQNAVTSESEQVLVLAGPGAGKTRVIVERAAHLIENCKVSPFELCLLTFTRKAAGEMRERIQERIGNGAHKITIGTFHAVALDLLHRFGELVGFQKQNCTVYGDWEEQFLLKEIAKELGLHNGKTWKGIKKKEISAVFAKYYQEGVEPDKEDPAYGIFKAFIARCRENNSYTYGSLLTGLKLLLPQIKQYLNWKHMVVDEAHDTDKLQWELIHTMKDYCNASLFAVADPDQAIYGWRGADVGYLLRNKDSFDIFKLETNYRSKPGIVRAANSLIQHNSDRLDKDMKAHQFDEGNQVFVVKDTDSEGIVKLSKVFVDEDICILARNHVFLNKMSRLMEEQKIKHTYVGKESALTKSEEFRRFHAFLKLIVNPYDNFSFLLISDLVGLSKADYADIRYKASQEGKSHFQVWYNSFVVLDNNKIFIQFYDSIEQWDFESTVGNLESIWYPSLSDWLGDTDHKPPFDFAPSLGFATNWVKDNPKGTTIDYLNWLATYDLQEEIKNDTKGIQLMTIHAAKGLEFPIVIIAGCNEGILPDKRSIAQDDVESERRLMYVAITRAESRLMLTVRPEASKYKGQLKVTPVSRFIKEAQVDDPCLEKMA
jgi:DNA helicase-2/ATP-dependent DNA helicase PcrA